MINRILLLLLIVLVAIPLTFSQNTTDTHVDPGLGESDENLTGDSVVSDLENFLNEPPPLSENETVEELDDLYIDIDLLNQSGQEFNGSAIVTNVTVGNETNTTVNETETEPVEEPEPIEETVEEPEPVYVPITLTTDKKEYVVGEAVSITMDGSTQSEVNLIIANEEISYAYSYSGENFPATYQFVLTNTPGKYDVTAFIYGDDSQQQVRTFFTVLPREEQALSVSIDSDTQLVEGVPNEFTAIVWGASEEATILWDFDDGGKASGTRVSHTYTTPGSYIVSVTVVDGESIASDTLIAHLTPMLHTVDIIVTTQDNAVFGADVTFGDEKVTTDGHGKASFKVEQGEYELLIEKEGYLSISELKTIENYEVSTYTLRTHVDVTQELTHVSSKTNSLVQNAYIIDDDGNTIDQIDGTEGKVNVVLDLNPQGLALQNVGGEPVVTIHEVEPLSMNWEAIDDVVVTTASIPSEIEDAAAQTLERIQIANVDGFVGQNYYGTVDIPLDTKANLVLYCPNDVDCEEIPSCLTFGGSACYAVFENAIRVYVPHYSTIIVALDNNTANLTIDSPDNETTLDSGEDVWLNGSITETVTLNYSLDGSPTLILGTGTSFSTTLLGSLQNVLANGNHTLLIGIQDAANNSAEVSYEFVVNDSEGPVVNVNGPANNSSLVNQTNVYHIQIQADETATITYELNNGSETINQEGRANSSVIALSLQEGLNTLVFRSEDVQGNNATLEYQYNFTLDDGITATCNDGIKNYHDGQNETGVDCGGPCTACVPFTITTDKSSYLPDQQVAITVISRPNSTVSFNVTGGGASFGATTTTFPSFYIFTSTTNPGTYTITGVSYYWGVPTNLITSFTVNSTETPNPLELELDANDTSVIIGQRILFEADVEGNTTALNITWDFDNDGDTENTTQEVVHVYSKNGTYTVNLSVQQGNFTREETETIEVKKAYNVSFTVRDNETNNPIQNARVYLDDINTNTSSDGKAFLTVPSKTYAMAVTKQNYDSFGNSTRIDGKVSFTIYLQADGNDTSAPSITILSPSDNEKVGSSPSIEFRVSDESLVDCTLFTSVDEKWWVEEDTKPNLRSDRNHSFTIEDAEEGEYFWRIECTDEDGRRTESPTFSFEVETGLIQVTADADGNVIRARELITLVVQIQKDFENLPRLEKEALQDLKWDELLSSQKIQLERASRDLSNVQWRRLNETDEQELIADIIARIDAVEDQIPSSISVLKSSEYVAYPQRADVEAITSAYLESKNVSLASSAFDDLLRTNTQLQSHLTPTTRYKLVQVGYHGGVNQTITLMNRQVRVTGNASDVVVVEHIPKSIADSTDEIVVIDDHEILNPDPLVKVNLTVLDDFSFSYFIIDEIALSTMEDAHIALLSEVLPESEGNFLTGFAVFEGFNKWLSQSGGTRLFIEIIIFIVLAVLYLLYSVGVVDKVAHKFTADKDVEALRKHIKDAEALLEQGKYDEAVQRYKGMAEEFKKLNGEQRRALHGEIVDLAHAIDASHIHRNLDTAANLIKEGKHAHAGKLYAEIMALYKRIAPKHKAKVLKRCMELHKLLQK